MAEGQIVSDLTSNRVAQELRGCTDGNCRLRFPRGLDIGMHTNGGCKCLTDLPTAKRLEAEKALAYRDREIARLTALLEQPPEATVFQYEELEKYSRDDGLRDWVSVGAWLHPGERIVLEYKIDEADPSPPRGGEPESILNPGRLDSVEAAVLNQALEETGQPHEPRAGEQGIPKVNPGRAGGGTLAGVPLRDSNGETRPAELSSEPLPHQPISTAKEMTMETVDSTSDQRTVNNVMRHAYRVLSDAEKAQMQAIKDKGLEFWELIDSIGASRELSLAKTASEEAVMWAVKHITK